MMIGASGIWYKVPTRAVSAKRGQKKLFHQRFFYGLDSATPDVAKRLLEEEIHPLEVTCRRIKE